MSSDLSSQQPPSPTVAQALQQAITHHHSGRLHEAEQLYRAILQTEPKHPDANYNLGVLAVQVSQPAASLPHLKVALNANPSVEQYWLSYMDALLQADQRSAARLVLEDVRRRGFQGEAIESFAVRLEEQSGSPCPNEIDRLLKLYTERHYTEATSLAHQMTQRFPLHGFGWKALGTALKQIGRATEALIALKKAAVLIPSDPEVHSNLGAVLRNLVKLDTAVVSYERALRIRPDFADAHNNLGVALKDLGSLDAAISSYRQALESKPDYAEAHSNLGNVFRDLGSLDGAIASHRRALETKPDYAEAHSNLGNVFRDLGLLDDAVASYRQALQIKPDFADAHSNLGLVLLLMGNFESGWPRYESRYDPTMTERSSIPPLTSIPKWRGEPIADKALLVWHEQGIGDEIQFCRYLSMLKARRTRRITLVCSAPLKSLFQRLDGADEILTIGEAENIPLHDYWTFPLSIPLHCNTTLNNIPAPIPYLYADKKCQQDIATQLANIPEFKVGVCWQGGKRYRRDAERSPGLEPFKRLFAQSGVRFFTLQRDSRDEFILAGGSKVLDLGHEVDSLTPPFEETAALIMNLDLVITCDTSIGHLAGALGQAVWVVLPFVPDWRWMMDREDSPWYPNTRLFRQTSRGDWIELFERVANRLDSVIEGGSPALWPIAKVG